MIDRHGIVGLALVVLFVAAAGWQATAAPAQSSGFVHVSGNHFVGIRGQTLRLIGVDRSGTEYACAGPVDGGGSGYGIFQGPTDDRSIRAMLSWDVNSVALPLNEACWLGGYAGLNPQFAGARYRAAIVRYARRLNHFGIYVVVRLSGAAPGDNAYGSDPSSADEIPMADIDHSVAFWASLAATFRSNKMVLFHTYDEPHGVDWACLLDGCTANDAPNGADRYGSYTTAGNQVIVDAIRAAGARQPIILSGPDFAADLSGWEEYLPLRGQPSRRAPRVCSQSSGGRRRLRRYQLHIEVQPQADGDHGRHRGVLPRLDVEHGPGLRRVLQCPARRRGAADQRPAARLLLRARQRLRPRCPGPLPEASQPRGEWYRVCWVPLSPCPCTPRPV